VLNKIRVLSSSRVRCMARIDSIPVSVTLLPIAGATAVLTRPRTAHYGMCTDATSKIVVICIVYRLFQILWECQIHSHRSAIHPLSNDIDHHLLATGFPLPDIINSVGNTLQALWPDV
jgi:hypothetical protein